MNKLLESYSDVKNSFSSLWQFKERGTTLEVITPYATTSAKFISVFISKQNNEFVVSDGGWIDEQVYDCVLEYDNDCFQKIHEHYLESFKIKQTTGLGDGVFYYKKTDSEKMISSLIMDLAVFISNMVSLAQVEYSDKEEKQSVKRFRRKANDYLKSFVDKDRLDTSGCLGEERNVRCDAFVRTTNSRFILINYITGSTNSNFTGSITKANFMFEMADKSKYKNYIKRKISLIDTSSKGYIPDKCLGFLSHLHENTEAVEINWADKKKFKELVLANLLNP